MKNPVTQEHPMGCAVACTAYILSCTYQQALKLYEKPKNAIGIGFYCPEIVIAMSKANRLYKYKQIRTLKNNILNIADTIVFIKKSDSYPAGHFLARTSEGLWMNPWINFPMIASAQSGFQQNLPGDPLYALFPVES